MAKELERTMQLNEGKVIITRTTQEVLTLDQLERRISDADYQKQDLIRQSQDIKNRFDAVVAEENEYKQLLDEYEATSGAPNEVPLPDEPIILPEDTEENTDPQAEV